MHNVCQLGCGGSAEDSIEHYARCKVLRKAHELTLGLHEEYLLPLWLGVDQRQSEDGMLAVGALGAYAAYRTTNAARAQGGLSQEEAKRAFRQAAFEGMAGHKRLIKLVETPTAPRPRGRGTPRRLSKRRNLRRPDRKGR